MITLQLSDTTTAALTAQAAAHGVTLEAYIENILFSVPSRPTPRLSRDELDRLLDEEATSGSSPIGSFPRAELYNDHD